MKRIFNARIPVLIASTVALGVLTGYLISYKEISVCWLIAVIPLTAIIFLFSFILKKKKMMILALVFAVVFTGGALNSYYTLQNFKVCDVGTDKLYLITGTVKEKGSTSYGEYIIIDNATAYDDKLSGKVQVYLTENYGDFCDVGYKVQFYAELKFNDTFPYGELNYYAEDNIKYTCSNYTELTSTYHFSLSGSIRSHIKNTFYENLSYDTASVCCAMMLGDTQNVDDEALVNFRYGGIAHIFAVSGLHIGLVYGVLTFIFKKLRLNKYASAGLRIIAIILYAWICGFSVSSVRAVIMCATNIFAKLFHVKSDGLNNLGFAAVFILFVSPLSLFSVGFQLSVCGVGGIFLFSNLIKRNLKKIKIPDKISSGVSVPLGAQAGTFPVMLANFGYASGIGLLLNILVIPIVSILFTVLFTGTVFSLIIPPAASFIMQYSALPLEALLSFLVAANFENAIISSFGAGIFVPLYFIVSLAFSDKLNLKTLSRSMLAACGVSLLVICVLAQTYLPINGYKVTVSACNNGGSVIIKSTQGTVLIMTEDASLSRIKSNLHREHSTNLDGVIIIGGDYCAEAYDMSLNCSDVYVCSLNIPVQLYQTVDIHYEKNFTICGIEFEYIDGHNLTASIDGVNLLLSDDNDLPFRSCDMLISLHENYIDELEIVPCRAKYTVYFNIPKTEYNAYDHGNLTFNIQNGEISF
ncbi:MAG: ComEC/Rec2 family competence protein [Clostridia bacterium]|nr:ComEC/Rec2 family competence protein [Clostridia bacterium]